MKQGSEGEPYNCYSLLCVCVEKFLYCHYCNLTRYTSLVFFKFRKISEMSFRNGFLVEPKLQQHVVVVGFQVLHYEVYKRLFVGDSVMY
jgi:hypothetical protein